MMVQANRKPAWTWAVALAVGELSSSENPIICCCSFNARIIDVANDFPHCNAVAVDLIPMQES